MEKKKLSLKKETIEVLNQNEMNQVYGGGSVGLACNTENNCWKTLANSCAGGCGGKGQYIGTEERINESYTNVHQCNTRQVNCLTFDYLPNLRTQELKDAINRKIDITEAVYLTDIL